MTFDGIDQMGDRQVNTCCFLGLCLCQSQTRWGVYFTHQHKRYTLHGNSQAQGLSDAALPEDVEGGCEDDDCGQFYTVAEALDHIGES